MICCSVQNYISNNPNNAQLITVSIIQSSQLFNYIEFVKIEWRGLLTHCSGIHGPRPKKNPREKLLASCVTIKILGSATISITSKNLRSEDILGSQTTNPTVGAQTTFLLNFAKKLWACKLLDIIQIAAKCWRHIFFKAALGCKANAHLIHIGTLDVLVRSFFPDSTHSDLPILI